MLQLSELSKFNALIEPSGHILSSKMCVEEFLQSRHKGFEDSYASCKIVAIGWSGDATGNLIPPTPVPVFNRRRRKVLSRYPFFCKRQLCNTRQFAASGDCVGHRNVSRRA